MQTIITNSPSETIEFANKLANSLSNPCIIGLDGDLGAGKTAFTQGLCQTWSCKEVVNSPTFTIINEYTGKAFPIYHVDLYRLNSLEEAYNIGLTDLLPSPDGITIVEWASHIKDIFPKNFILITIKNLSETKREITIDENFSY